MPPAIVFFTHSDPMRPCKQEHKIITRPNQSENQELKTRVVNLRLENLREHFRSTLQEAAEKLGISTTALKRCRLSCLYCNDFNLMLFYLLQWLSTYGNRSMAISRGSIVNDVFEDSRILAKSAVDHVADNSTTLGCRSNAWRYKSRVSKS